MSKEFQQQLPAWFFDSNSWMWLLIVSPVLRDPADNCKTLHSSSKHANVWSSSAEALLANCCLLSPAFSVEWKAIMTKEEIAECYSKSSTHPSKTQGKKPWTWISLGCIQIWVHCVKVIVICNHLPLLIRHWKHSSQLRHVWHVVVPKRGISWCFLSPNMCLLHVITCGEEMHIWRLCI